MRHLEGRLRARSEAADDENCGNQRRRSGVREQQAKDASERSIVTIRYCRDRMSAAPDERRRYSPESRRWLHTIMLTVTG